jgi:hypothetical protein
VKIDAGRCGFYDELIRRALEPEHFEAHSSFPLPREASITFAGMETFLNAKVPPGELWLVQGQKIIGKIVNIAIPDD